MILKSYMDSPPLDYDRIFYEENLFLIAKVLKYWNHEDDYIDKWIQIKENSNFENVRKL